MQVQEQYELTASTSYSAPPSRSPTTMRGDLRGDTSDFDGNAALHARTLRKLDFLLLPFLSLLFLFNSLDKSNVRTQLGSYNSPQTNLAYRYRTSANKRVK
jgi:hypothetical protein